MKRLTPVRFHIKLVMTTTHVMIKTLYHVTKLLLIDLDSLLTPEYESKQKMHLAFSLIPLLLQHASGHTIRDFV